MRMLAEKGKCPGCGKRMGIPETSAPSDTEIDKILDMLGDHPARKGSGKDARWT